MVTVEVAETKEGVMEVLTKELNPMTGRTPDLGTNDSEKPTTHSCTAELKCGHGGQRGGYSWGTPLGDGPCSTRGWTEWAGSGGVGFRYNAESGGLNLGDDGGGGGTWGYTRCNLGEVTGSGEGSNLLSWGGTPLKHAVAQPMSVASGGIGYGAWATGLGGASPHPWWYGMGFDGEHKAVAPPAPTSASTRKIVNSSSEKCRVEHERLGSSSADKNSGSKPVTGTRDPMKPESSGPAGDDAIQRMLARRCTDTAGFHSRLALAAEADHYEPHPEDGSLESSADEEGGVGSLSGFSLWRDRSAVSFGSARTHRAKTVLEVMEEEKGTNSNSVNDGVSDRSGDGNRNDLGGAGAGASSLVHEAPDTGSGGMESFTDGVPMATCESGNPYLGLAPALRTSPLPKPSFLSLEGAGEPEEEVAFDRTFDFPFSYGDGLGGNADSVATCWNNDDAAAAATAAVADVKGTPGFSLWDALDFDHRSGDLCDAGVRRGGATSGVCLPNGEHCAVGDDEADEAALVSAAERVLEGEDGEVSSSVETLPSNGRAAWSVVNAPATAASAASVAAVADGQPRECSANTSPAVAAAEVGHRRRRSTLTRCCWSIEEETRKGQSIVDGDNDDRTSSSMGAAAGDKDGERGEDATSPASLAHVGQCKTEGATAGATGVDEVGEASGTGTRWSELFASARTTNTDGHRGRILTVSSIDRSGSCAKGGSTICGHAHGNGTANGVPLVDSAPPSPADAEAVGPTVTVGTKPNSGGGSSFTTNTTTNSISSGSSGSSGTVEVGGRNQVSSSGRMPFSGSKPAPDGSVVGAQTSVAGGCANISNSSNSSSNSSSSSSSIDGREGLAGVPMRSRNGSGVGDGGPRASLRVENDAGGGGAGGAQSGCGGRSDGGGGGSVEPCGDGQRSQDSSTRTARSSTTQGAANGEDEGDAAPADICTGGHDNDTNITGTAVAWEETSGQLLAVEEVLRNLTLPPEPPLRAMLPDAGAGGHAVAGEGLPPPNAAATPAGDTLNSGIIGGGSGSGGGVVNDGGSGGVGADPPSSAVAPAVSHPPSASWLSRAASCSPAGALRGWTQRAAAIVVAATGSATTPAGPSPARGASVARAGPMRPEGKRTNEDGRKPPGAAEKVRLGAGWRTHVAAPLHRVDFSYCCEEWGVRGARRTSRFVDGSPL